MTDSKLNRADLYQTVTDRIISQLEAGTVPWVQPWRNNVAGAAVALPHNAATGRNYSGVNVLLLWVHGMAVGHRSHGWLTYKQAAELGGHVRAGEHGVHVVYADRFIPKSERAKPDEDQKARYFLKAYTVFNREQCDGLPAAPDAPPAPTMPELHEAADRLIRNSGARIAVAGSRAYYDIGRDCIAVPPIEAYEPNAINWYRTTLHELTHWTGAEHRLARKFANRHGSPDYAREELVAEMGAAFTCAALGIEPTVRHADYIGSWLRVLREDNRAIVSAASQASKAADYLLKFADVAELKAAA